MSWLPCDPPDHKDFRKGFVGRWIGEMGNFLSFFFFFSVLILNLPDFFLSTQRMAGRQAVSRKDELRCGSISCAQTITSRQHDFNYVETMNLQITISFAG